MGALLQATIGGIALVLWLLIFGRMLLSWFDPMARTAAARFLISMTEWLLAPVRRMIPQAGMLDFSGLLVLILLGALMRAAL